MGGRGMGTGQPVRLAAYVMARNKDCSDTCVPKNLIRARRDGKSQSTVKEKRNADSSHAGRGAHVRTLVAFAKRADEH